MSSRGRRTDGASTWTRSAVATSRSTATRGRFPVSVAPSSGSRPHASTTRQVTRKWPKAEREGFWSLVKRGFGGVYHSVSAKYLDGYLNEYAWRYNHREDGKAQFASLLLRAALPN